MTLTTEQLISVIMPCYNSESHLHEAIESVLKQNYSNLELLIVDDGSTDNSVNILEQFKASHSDRIKVFSQKNQGPYPARNYALKHARGEYICFLDADDYWDSECLSKLYNAIISSQADIAYCGWQNVGASKLNPEPYIPPEYEKGDTVKFFLNSCPWPIHAALVHKDIINKTGGFSERFFSSMDFDLWLRILTVSKNMVRVPECLAFYRWHDAGQISSVSWKQAINAWHVRQDFIAANPELVAHFKPAELKELSHGLLREKAFEAYWARDIQSAYQLSRKVIMTGYWRWNDLKYLLPALLPESGYCKLIQLADK